MTKTDSREEKREGVVSARKCDCCGHHEIGVLTDDGEYVAVKPGMRVIIIHQTDRGANESSSRD